jgi:prevent-host-death family protein
MSATLTVEETQINLKDLIDQVAAGQEIIITRNQQPVARVISEPSKPKPRLRPPPGLGKGMMTIISDDDEHLKDFAEYMP